MGARVKFSHSERYLLSSTNKGDRKRGEVLVAKLIQESEKSSFTTKVSCWNHSLSKYCIL